MGGGVLLRSLGCEPVIWAADGGIVGRERKSLEWHGGWR